jgi:uncharacterized protein with von Willebrand factor type A (vWA) domain
VNGGETPTPASGHLATRLVLFGRELRSRGLGVTSPQISLLVEAITCVGVGDRHRVRDAVRAVLCKSVDEIAVVDDAFDQFWRQPAGRERDEARTTPIPPPGRLPPAEVAIARRLGRDFDAAEPSSDRSRTWSAAETLRRKRFDRLTDEEAAALTRLMARARPPVADRLTRRYAPAPRGRQLDWLRTIRAAVRHDGELVERRWRRRERTPRPLVLLVDISGSMERYSRMMLTLLHALGRQSSRRRLLEVFVFGTRLTRLTHALAARRVDEALAKAADAVVDWAGGTRIGASLHAFNREWSRHVLARGARLAIVSDGWDQGDPDLVSRELGRLRRAARRIYWLNPLMDLPGYEARTAGLVAAAPHVDAMLPADSLHRLEQALTQIDRAGRRLQPAGRCGIRAGAADPTG